MGNKPNETSVDPPLANENPFKGILGLNSVVGWTEYAEMARRYLDVCNTGTLRLVVLETWLLMDYTLRQILMAGLNLPRTNYDRLDLREQLLPGFERCLDLIIKIRNLNETLGPVDPRTQMRIGLLLFMQKHYPTLLDQFTEAENVFLTDTGELKVYEASRSLLRSTGSPEPRYVSDAWLKMTNVIDKSWRDEVMKLNGARNKAAHTYDESAIAEKLGCSGPRALERAKAKCRELVGRLLDVSEDSDWIKLFQADGGSSGNLGP